MPSARTAAAFMIWSCLSEMGATSVPKSAPVTKPARFTVRKAARPSMRRHLWCLATNAASRLRLTAWVHLCLGFTLRTLDLMVVALRYVALR